MLIIKMQLMNKQTYDKLCGMGNQKAKGGITSLFFGGYKSPPDERKEGDTMITYQDFFLFCTFIVALISLLYQIFKGKK